MSGLAQECDAPQKPVKYFLPGAENNLFEWVEDVVVSLRLTARTSFPRTMIGPLVKVTSSRSWVISFQPACRSAGVMNFGQVPRSLSCFMFIGSEPAPSLGHGRGSVFGKPHEASVRTEWSTALSDRSDDPS